LIPGSTNSTDITMGNSSNKYLGLIRYKNNDGSMHFWAGNTPILELTSQRVTIPANKSLVNNGILRVIGESIFKDDVSIDEADLYVRKNISTNAGGNLNVEQNVTFSGLSTTTGQSGYEMIVADSNGLLYNMDMSGMGGHWQTTDADGDGTDDAVHTSLNIGIGTNAPQSTLHIDNPSGSDVTITTDWGLKMQHYDGRASWANNATRTFLRKSWPNSIMGDVLYLGSTGNSSNDQQSALLLTENKGVQFGTGNNNGQAISTKWLTVESDTTVLYPDATNASSDIGSANFIINDMDNSGYGGMYVNAPLPFYGYAVDGNYKVFTYYVENNGTKELKWSFNGAFDRMKLDNSGNLEIKGHFATNGSAPTCDLLNNNTGSISLSTNSTDMAGTFTVTVSDHVSQGNDAIFGINFSQNYNNPPIVMITPANGTGAWRWSSAEMYVNSSTTGFTIHSVNSLGNSGGSMKFNYMVVESN
jgi:hypothetical protein